MVELTGNVESIALASWQVWCEMAPYLLAGFVVAGVLSIFISADWVERHLGRRGLSSVWKASLLGVPLPLCSCGVIPVAASMRRHGASRAAVTAFLISTPQTGVDSIAATYALLGPVFAAFRPVAALISGMFGGVLVLLLGESKQEQAAEEAAPPRLHRAVLPRRPLPARPAPRPGLRPGHPPPRRRRRVAAGRPHRRRHGRAGAEGLGARLPGRRHPLDPALDGRRRARLRLRHRLGAHRRRFHPHGRLARRRLGLPHRRLGHQPRHLHHRLESARPPQRPRLPPQRRRQRRRLRAAAGPALRLPRRRRPAARPPTCMP